MKVVLLSGGSGKRLWPLSNDSRSKQFIKILENSDGQMESMLQRIWQQLSAAGLDADASVVTGRSQVDMIRSQLQSKVQIIVEPARRDTFPAIALAASYLHSVEGVSPDTVIVVLPVDSYVQEAFFDTVHSLEKVLQQSYANMALVGVVPNYPSEKYGYIVPCKAESERADDADMSSRQVSHFREKPNREQAEALMEQQALWNCGVFAFRLHYLLEVMARKGLPADYEQMSEQYNQLAATSFDYDVVEEAENVVVVPYSGVWKDLGTWNTLTEEMHIRQIGSGIVTEDSTNTHLINELGIPVTIIGATDLIVAASPDGILVSSKAESPRIKEVLKHRVSRPRYVERNWGHYREIDCMKYEGGREVLTKRVFIRAGQNISYHHHHQRSEMWNIMSGTAQVILDEQMYRLNAGDVIRIPAGTRHSILAESDVELIEVQSSPERVEEDIVRIHLNWNDIPLRQQRDTV